MGAAATSKVVGQQRTPVGCVPQAEARRCANRQVRSARRARGAPAARRAWLILPVRFPDDGHKSLEGSLAFFTVAFLGTAGALLLAGPTAGVAVPGVALTLALLLTLVEAISWRGLDNLLIPVTGFIFLESLMDSNLVALLVSVLLIAAILGAIMIPWGQPQRAR